MVLLIMAACSGTGKSTLAKRLLAERPVLRLSVSHTTRAPRPGERDGADYHFIDAPRFRELIAAEAFAEWAEYAGNLYGTSHAEIARAAEAGQDLLFDVDVVGAEALKRAYPAAISVFILPPSLAELERRLRARGTETEASLAKRLSAARRELAVAHTFDHLVVNDDVETGFAELAAVHLAARVRQGERRALLDALRGTV